MADVANTTKILALKKILFDETDEEHKLSVMELIEKLQRTLDSNDPIDKK
ncbi:hypothetical protein QNK12_15055 [Neobacillus cucumis]|nr:hypothetical protein QNK12_15055 [Neobacillus cucumis]